MSKPLEFFVVVERDEDGMYVGEVPKPSSMLQPGPHLG